jgi:lyso-ornithine lipid O-acyltransferase
MAVGVAQGSIGAEASPALSPRRAFGRVRAALHLLLALTLIPRWVWRGPSWKRYRTRQWLFFGRIARAFVPRVRVVGTPDPAVRFLVANHISWLDIPVLGSKLRTNFIAKDDVSDWPGIGPLARRTETLFVSRTRRCDVARQAGMIADRLDAGDRLLLFAEGTTSDGTEVLPFRSSLFAAALACECVQPVMIGYRWSDGARISDEEMARIGWTGDATLIENAIDIAAMPIRAEVWLLDPIAIRPGETRQALSARCETAIANAYAAFRAANRSA